METWSVLCSADPVNWQETADVLFAPPETVVLPSCVYVKASWSQGSKPAVGSCCRERGGSTWDRSVDFQLHMVQGGNLPSRMMVEEYWGDKHCIPCSISACSSKAMGWHAGEQLYFRLSGGRGRFMNSRLSTCIDRQHSM